MRKVLIFTTLMSVLFVSFASAADIPVSEPTQMPDAPFRLFRTTNIWTFLKLDTQDGRIWQVQFDVQGDNRGTVILSDEPLIDAKNRRPGRFTLYPTTNIYNFILLDQIDGRTWQVQWAQEPELRGIVSIK